MQLLMPDASIPNGFQLGFKARLRRTLIMGLLMALVWMATYAFLMLVASVDPVLFATAPLGVATIAGVIGAVTIRLAKKAYRELTWADVQLTGVRSTKSVPRVELTGQRVPLS